MLNTLINIICILISILLIIGGTFNLSKYLNLILTPRMKGFVYTFGWTAYRILCIIIGIIILGACIYGMIYY